jgi:protein-S-isoprenylcysteine O-methyltransferase Ste14
MRGTRLEFRFRVLIIFFIYFLGFYAPWERYTATSRVEPLWSWLAISIAHLGWMKVGDAYVAITLAAIALMAVGAFWRVVGTAYLGHAVMRDGRMHADTVLAAGPYRHVRNPLYMGNWFTAVATSILMPATGALFFVAAMTFFLLRLIGGEEAHLASEQGAAYQEYRARVPRLMPSLRARVADSGARPAWLSSLAAECYSIAITVCFAVLAWRYDAMLLTRCVLICFGASLLVHALMPRQEMAAEG